jgi:hypothetical protein
MKPHTKLEITDGIKMIFKKLPGCFIDEVQFPKDIDCKDECPLVQLSIVAGFIEKLCIERTYLYEEYNKLKKIENENKTDTEAKNLSDIEEEENNADNNKD